MKIKFTQVVIGIIVCLALVSFLTDCNSDKPNPFLLLYSKMGLMSTDISGSTTDKSGTNKSK